MYFVVKTST